ncbi:MAG: MFS transporter [Xanthomonadales bacterium]|jgi:MFS family permease|nr:MFS transporter [Xanthomonadales bacterium]
MLTSLRPIAALLLAVLLLISGSGLLGTLLAVRGNLLGISDAMMGVVMSAYFVGFLVGTWTGPPLIRRVGHIRAFAIGAALATAAALGHALTDSPWMWAALRMLSGLALVTLYTVIESWLNADAPPSHRGQVFAVYMGANLLALAIGQQLLLVAPIGGFELFTLVALLSCLALVPVAWTRQPQPQLSEPRPYGVLKLWRSAPSAAVGAALSGVVMGSFWGLGPVAAARIGLEPSAIAGFMTAAIVGGAALQWPMGRWSDRNDRRRVLAITSLGAALLAVLLLFALQWPPLRLTLIFAYGGLAFALYPIAVAHMMDRLDSADMLGASASFLLLYGVGAAVGPVLAGQAMAAFGPGALFAGFACTLLMLGAFVFRRLQLRDSAVEGRIVFMPMLRTTPSVLEMVPEVDAEPVPESGVSQTPD